MRFVFDTKYAEHKSAGCQFFSVHDFFNCLLNVWMHWLSSSAPVVKDQIPHCLSRFLGEVHISQWTKQKPQILSLLYFLQKPVKNNMHKRKLRTQKESNLLPDLLSTQCSFFSLLIPQKRNHSVSEKTIFFGRSILCDSYTSLFQWPFH